MNRADALNVALRGARDSIPPLRLRVLADVNYHPMARTSDVVKRLQLPRQTVDRTLQELHLLELLIVDDEPYGDGKHRWLYQVADTIDSPTLANLTRNVTTQVRAPNLTRNVTPPVERTGGNPRCTVCGKPNLYHPQSIERGICAACAKETA
jgi:hypothetical protein